MKPMWLRAGSLLTEEEKKSIIILRAEDYSIMEIVAISGRSKSTVVRVLRHNRETT